MPDAGVQRFPAEAPETLVGIGPAPVRTPGDAVAIAVVGIGMGEQVLFRDGREQPHADQRWRNPRREQPVVLGFAMRRLDAQQGLAQGGARRSASHGDCRFAVGRVGGLGLELVAVAGMRLRVAGGVADADAHDRGEAVRVVEQRIAAPAVAVAAVAGVGVEQRAEAVAGGRRSGRAHPGRAKEGEAAVERQLGVRVQVLRWRDQGVGRLPASRPRRSWGGQCRGVIAARRRGAVVRSRQSRCAEQSRH